MTQAMITEWPSLVDTTGRTVSTDWQRLFKKFSHPGPFLGDRQQPGWSAAVFDPPARSSDNVRRVTALVLDYDGGTTLDEAEERWGDCFGLIHTTRKHTDAAPRFRVVLPFSRDVSPYEYAAIWRRVYADLGGKVDDAPKDASRFWYCPGLPDGGAFETRTLTGAFLDPDAILSRPEPSNGQPRPAPVIPIRTTPSGQWSPMERARAYIAALPEAISGARGHTATFNVARKLADFGLSEGEILSVLTNEYNPRCQPPWSQKELEHKASEAFHKRTPRPIEDRPMDRPSHGPSTTRTPEDIEREAIQTEPTAEPPTVEVLTVRQLLADAANRALSKQPTGACTTGVDGIDRKTGGMRPGHVWLLGADTSWGKSSVAIMFADVNMAKGKRVLIASTEDAPSMYGDRLMVRRSRVNALRFRDRQLTSAEMRTVTDVAAAALPLPVYLDCIGVPAERAAQMIAACIEQHNIDLVIVDYLQELRSGQRSQDRRNEVANVASLIRTTIKRAGKTGIILSQITVGDAKKYPDKHSIRESRDVSNGAEVILLGFTPQEAIINPKTGTAIVDAGQKCILIDKAKDGITGAVAMKWDDECACFDEIDPAPHPSDEYMSPDWEDG